MTTRTSPQGLPCPVCKVDLLMSERQGIEIDYCPQCRGVWLDRGELDKIIERSISETQPTERREGTLGVFGSKHGSDRADGHGSRGGHYGRRKGFLRDLFD